MALTREERVANLAASNDARHERSRTAVAEALAGLLREKKRVTVSAVAQRAGVSRTFLYKQADLLAAVHEAAAGEPERLHRPRATPSAEANLRARLVAAMDALAEAKVEIADLRALVERLTAELAKSAAS